MTKRQKILKIFYPIFMRLAKITKKNTSSLSNTKTIPPVSFYSLQGIKNDGSVFDCYLLKGKKVLLVNTASDCGYTKQYTGLEKLYERYKNKLAVIAFPANDFKEQEKEDDTEIEKFCTVNYGVTFPLMKKSSVVKGPSQNEIFQWLTDAAKNGWNSQHPEWNFCKYIIDEEGKLTHYFGSTVEPLGKEIMNAITD